VSAVKKYYFARTDLAAGKGRKRELNGKFAAAINCACGAMTAKKLGGRV
jgi:hypothetical protein